MTGTRKPTKREVTREKVIGAAIEAIYRDGCATSRQWPSLLLRNRENSDECGLNIKVLAAAGR